MKFNDRVYELTKKVPRGKVTTYKEIAKKLRTKAYRAVGNALRHNPYAPEVPCHRVVKTDGSLGGFGGKFKNMDKVKLLRKEGVKVEDFKIKDFGKILFRF